MISDERINALIDRLVSLGLLELLDEPSQEERENPTLNESELENTPERECAS